MTDLPIGNNQHYCEGCLRFFSSKSNLRRHQTKTMNSCTTQDRRKTTRKIVDPQTGLLRYRSMEEQKTLERDRKRRQYYCGGAE